MGKLIPITGDIFTSDAPALGHGVNCRGMMGTGLAPLVKNKYPDMYPEYQNLCRKGTLYPGQVFIWNQYEGDHFIKAVYNIASQFEMGANAKYKWLSRGVDKALEDADMRGFDRIALPRIGAGIGGLDWGNVEQILGMQAWMHEADIEIWTLPGNG